MRGNKKFLWVLVAVTVLFLAASVFLMMPAPAPARIPRATRTETRHSLQSRGESPRRAWENGKTDDMFHYLLQTWKRT